MLKKFGIPALVLAATAAFAAPRADARTRIGVYLGAPAPVITQPAPVVTQPYYTDPYYANPYYADPYYTTPVLPATPYVYQNYGWHHDEHHESHERNFRGHDRDGRRR